MAGIGSEEGMSREGRPRAKCGEEEFWPDVEFFTFF
jgi:hypothetical protein